MCKNVGVLMDQYGPCWECCCVEMYLSKALPSLMGKVLFFGDIYARFFG
jgi:hypothetical protein